MTAAFKDSPEFTVLVVDDTPANLMLMNDLLQPFYTVKVVTLCLLGMC